MGIQITVDPQGLTQQQKEAIAGFILAYPAGQSLDTLHLDVTADTSKLPIAPEDDPGAGSDAEALQAFGKGPRGIDGNPLVPGVNSAPSIAAVGQFSIAPDKTVVTSVQAVPLPPAVSLASVARPAAPPTINPATGVELDVNGLPWDKRIHVDSRAKLTDGSWRKKKQLDPVLLATVEAELRGVMSAPAPAFVPPPPAPLPSTTFTPSGTVSPPPPPQPAAAPTPAPSTGGDAVRNALDQYVSLVGKSASAMQANKITQAEITQVCQKYGVQALPLLANRLDLVASISEAIDALIASRG